MLLKPRNIFTLLFFFLCLFVTAFQSVGAITEKEREATYKQLEIFANVLSILQENYVEEINSHDAIEGAISGLLFSLDPHSSYLKPESFEELQNETSGNFTGIGIEITIKGGNLTIVSPIEGTPAHEAGLEVNDIIVKIDGVWTKEMSPTAAIKMLRGPKGSEVTISIHRDGWQELKEFILKRDIIPLKSVISSFVAPGLAYSKITNFQTQTTLDFINGLETLQEKQKITGLVLDLRNNPGGLLNQAVSIADIFIDSGLIVYTKGRTKEQNMVFQARKTENVRKYPIVVLVNEGSASASEIVAGALQDHKRGIILGTQTFGKGSVQTIVPLPEGAGLRLTTAHYFTPNGRSIQVKGITPDVKVPFLKAPETITADHRDITREANLKNHLQNQKNEEDTPKLSDLDLTGKSIVDPEMVEKLKKDNQLRSAVHILKSLNLYSDFRGHPTQKR